MKKKIVMALVVMLVICFFLIVACVPAVEKEVSPSRAESISLPPIDPAIAVLLNKNKDAVNYNYVYDAEKVEGYTLYRIGNKVKKMYWEPIKFGPAIFFNTFYLDFEKKTAFGTCEKLGVTCTSQWNKAYPLDFSSQTLALSPMDLASAVPITAKKVGGENVDGRSTEIIEYLTAEGKLERLSLDKFYGLPLKQVIFSSADPKSEVQVKHTYTRLAVGQLKEKEVIFPEGMKVVNSE